MKTIKNIAAIVVVVMVLLSLSPIVVPLMVVHYVVAQNDGNSVNVNKSSEIEVRVQVLVLMLNNTLTLNISDELKHEIENLLAVNISSLSLDELREWIRNASSLLSRVASEIRENRMHKIGIVLERYLNGLRIALENRFRVCVRLYNVSIDIDEIVANATQARDVNQLFKMYRGIAKEVEVKKAGRFAEAIRKHINATINTIVGGEVRGLDRVAENLNKPLHALNKTIEKLKAMNVSESVIETLEEARGHIRLARELIISVSKEVKSIEQERIKEQERIRDMVNRSLKMLIEKANNRINEILEELNQLRDKALSANLTVIVVKIDNLTTYVEEIRGRLLEITTVKDINIILNELARIERVIEAIEQEVNKALNAMGQNLGERVKDLANKAIEEAEEILEKVKEMLNETKNTINNIVCIAIYPPPPICIAIRNAEKLLPLIEKKVNEAEILISKAKELYAAGRYMEALAYASRALGMLKSAEHQLNEIQNILKALQERGPRR